MADTKTIAILGALGVAAYGYYQGWFASLGLPAPTAGGASSPTANSTGTFAISGGGTVAYTCVSGVCSIDANGQTTPGLTLQQLQYFIANGGSLGLPTNAAAAALYQGGPSAPASPTSPVTTSNTMAPVTPPAALPASPGGGGPGTQPSLLASQLVAAAGGGNPTLTVDQWNYYLQQIQPSTNSSAITGALSTLGISRGQSNFSMTASQYTGYLAQLNLAGLSGLGYVPSGRVPRSVIQAARWRHR